MVMLTHMITLFPYHTIVSFSVNYLIKRNINIFDVVMTIYDVMISIFSKLFCLLWHHPASWLVPRQPCSNIIGYNYLEWLFFILSRMIIFILCLFIWCLRCPFLFSFILVLRCESFHKKYCFKKVIQYPVGMANDPLSFAVLKKFLTAK